MNNSNTALISGASGGIGMELARYHARRGGDLVLVARSAGRLESLKRELEGAHGVKVTVIVEDLAVEGAAARIADATDAAGIDVDILVNNAGFGGHGEFHRQSLEHQTAMMQVNMRALTELTYFYLPAMVERGFGRILNVSSTASFMPGPLQAVYYATKSYVTSFSQALAEELRDSNVTVSALCPGAVDTGFVKAGNLEGVDLWKNARSAASVAECGYRAMEAGKLVVFNETGLRIMLNWVVPLLPRSWVLKLSRQAMEKGVGAGIAAGGASA